MFAVSHHSTLSSRGRKLTDSMKTLDRAPTQQRIKSWSNNALIKSKILFKIKLTGFAQLHPDQPFTNHPHTLKILAQAHISIRLNSKVTLSQLMLSVLCMVQGPTKTYQLSLSQYQMAYPAKKWLQLPTLAWVLIKLDLHYTIQIKTLTDTSHLSSTLQWIRQSVNYGSQLIEKKMNMFLEKSPDPESMIHRCRSTVNSSIRLVIIRSF